MKLQRYKLYRDAECFCEIDESDSGDYVKASEAEATIKELEAEVERLTKAKGVLQDFFNFCNGLYIVSDYDEECLKLLCKKAQEALKQKEQNKKWTAEEILKNAG